MVAARETFMWCGPAVTIGEPRRVSAWDNYVGKRKASAWGKVDIMLSDFVAGRNWVGTETILLVEDEVLIRTILAEEIRSQSVTVIEASTADEAWAYLTAGGQADLVFSDIHMPGSMDGLELARRIKADFPDIKVIITSGNAGTHSPGDKASFLPKPYQIGEAVTMMLNQIRA
jgi:CheY-like chemotaxis protein